MPHPEIDIAAYERYKNAPIVRSVVQRMNPTPPVNITNHVQTHDITYHREREIDARVELGAADSEASFLIRHHISEGVRTARFYFDELNSQFPTVGRNRPAYENATNWIHSALHPRIVPAMYAAKLEIDPEGVYEQEYQHFTAEYLTNCLNIQKRFTTPGQKRTKASKLTEKNLYKQELEKFLISLEDWSVRAIADLAPTLETE